MSLKVIRGEPDVGAEAKVTGIWMTPPLIHSTARSMNTFSDGTITLNCWDEEFAVWALKDTFVRERAPFSTAYFGFVWIILGS
jgi:hypothetical protein